MKRTNVHGGLPQRREEIGVHLRVRRLNLCVAHAQLIDADAVELLREWGLVVTVPGMGTYVRKR